MRIKTLRLKVESNDQDYFVDDFFLAQTPVLPPMPNW